MTTETVGVFSISVWLLAMTTAMTLNILIYILTTVILFGMLLRVLGRVKNAIIKVS